MRKKTELTTKDAFQKKKINVFVGESKLIA